MLVCISLCTTFSSFADDVKTIDDTTVVTLESIRTSRFPSFEYNQKGSKLLLSYWQRGVLDSACLVGKSLFGKEILVFRHVWLNPTLLLQVEMNNLSEDSLPSNFFRLAKFQQDRYKLMADKILAKGSFGTINWSACTTLVDWQIHKADSLCMVLDTSTVNYLIALYFKGDFDKFYSILQHNPQFSNTRLRNLYEIEASFIDQTKSGRYGATVGYISPMSGNLNFLGSMICVDGFLGYRYFRLFGDIGFRLTPTKKSIAFVHNDSIFEGKYVGGIGFYTEFGYEIFRHFPHQIDFIAGYESIGNIINDISPQIKDTTQFNFSSQGISVGIGYRYFPPLPETIIGLYIEFFYRYSVYDLKNSEGKDIKGGATCLRITLAPNDHIFDHSQRRALRVK